MAAGLPLGTGVPAAGACRGSRVHLARQPDGPLGPEYVCPHCGAVAAPYVAAWVLALTAAVAVGLGVARARLPG